MSTTSAGDRGWIVRLSEAKDGAFNVQPNIPDTLIAQISQIQKPKYVAVITFVGTLCPVTKAHIMCIIEARKIVNEQFRSRFPTLDSDHALIIAIISVNSDQYVQDKLKDEAISAEIRRKLINLATVDEPWIFLHTRAWNAFEELESRFENINFRHFEVDGADVALTKKTWNHSSDHHIRIAMGRSGDEATQQILDKISSGEIDNKRHFFILGPILPSYSSTLVRNALRNQDRRTLEEMLHPSVLDWLLKNNP